MRENTWTNADGLTIGFGAADTKNLEAGSIQTKGRVHQIELEVYYDQDPNTPSVKNAYVPAGAHILRADLAISESFVGGTNLKAGTVRSSDGSTDSDALILATTPANLTANSVVVGTGAIVGDVTANDFQLSYATTGSFTAGRGTLLVEYVVRSAR